MEYQQLIMALGAALLIAPILSRLTDIVARSLFLRHAPEPARKHAMELERTLKLIAALRRRQHISEAEMIQLSRQVVATALTADRGERLLDELRDVKVDGDPQKNEGLLREASQLLQMRFAREQPQ